MSEMVSDDVKSGMNLLMNKLLPMVIEKLKNAEARITELESKVEALTAKPKRTRKKKEELAGIPGDPGERGPAGTVGDVQEATKHATIESVSEIERLYEMSTGTKLDRVTIGTSSDGTAMTINDEIVTSDAMRAVQDAFAEYPTATVTDVATALNLSVLVVCYVAVTFKLYDFGA